MSAKDPGRFWESMGEGLGFAIVILSVALALFVCGNADRLGLALAAWIAGSP